MFPIVRPFNPARLRYSSGGAGYADNPAHPLNRSSAKDRVAHAIQGLPLGKPSADNCICRFRWWQLHEEAPACYRSCWFGISWSWQNVMRGNLSTCVLVASALLGNVAALGAEQFATADDARAMLDRAIAALKANKVAALAAFNDEKNKDFHDRDLYIFCFSLPDGNFTAYQSPLMLGTNVRELKLDKDAIGQRAYEIVATAAEGDVVSMDFSFPKPGSKVPATKQSLETRIGNQACGVSYFK
jgi:hypothetical protein